MEYDFITQVDRTAHGARKWDAVFEQSQDVPADVVPLSVADMEFRNAPEIVESLKNVLERCILGYAGPTDEYYQSIIDWMQRRHGFHVESEWIVTTPGVVTALKFLVKTLTRPKDGVIILTPSYPPFRKAILYNDCEVVESSLLLDNGDYTIDFQDLERKAKEKRNTLMILCSPHNPVGRVWTEGELRKIGDICLENGVMLVSDEIHHDLIMPGYQHHVLATLDERYDKFITCTSCSKTFNLAGMKVSNIIIKDEKTRLAFQRNLSDAGHGSLNILGYAACIAAYNKGEAWLRECLKVIHENDVYLRNFIQENLPMLKVKTLQGTYLQWVDFRGLGLDAETLEAECRRSHLYFSEGYTFGTLGEGFERINLACPKKTLQKALERLKNMVDSLEGK